MSTAPTGAPIPPPYPPQQIPPKRNDAVLWIIAIVAGGFVVVVLCGLLLAGMFIRRVHVKESGKQVEIETPAGSLRVNGDQAHATGLPVYPGAEQVQSEGSSVELSAAGGAGLGIATEKYMASADLDEVTEWYQQHLGPGYHRGERGSATHHEHVSSSADVSFVYDKGDTTRIVALTKKSDGIEIELVRIGKKEVQ
ncbi:MAG: hypothetical protein ACRD59_18800 [Candidatus Acidiferrales bacterium]